MRIEFTVWGVPQPQGSTRAFVSKATGKAAITSDNPNLKPWRQQMALTAALEMQGQGPTRSAVNVQAEFAFPPPKRQKGQWKTTRPDVDKLIRAVLDSMTGVVFADDSQVVGVIGSKIFGRPGAHVIVHTLEGE